MITFTGLDGMRKTGRELAGLGRRLASLKPLHQAAGRELLAWIDRNFEAEGRLSSATPGGWPPLARATLAAKRRRGGRHGILVDSGRLRRGFRITATASQVRLINPVPYAARHQLGLGVPRRPFLPDNSQVRRLVHPIAERFFERLWP